MLLNRDSADTWSSPPAAETSSSFQLKWLLLIEKEFLFGIRKPPFLGIHHFCFLSEASWGNLLLNLFILCFLFIFFNPDNVQESDLTDKMKCSFFQAAVMLILLYGCTTWTLTKQLEEKLDSNYTRMLRAILNKSWQQHPTKHQLYGHLPPTTKPIQVRQTRHAGHCWRSRDGLISDILLWSPTYGRAKAGRPARTYVQQLCEDTGCSPEDLPWTIGKSGSGISVLVARHDDDDILKPYLKIVILMMVKFLS